MRGPRSLAIALLSIAVLSMAGCTGGAADSSTSSPAPEAVAADAQPTPDSADESPDDPVAAPSTDVEEAQTPAQPGANVRTVPVDVTYRDDEYGVEIEVQQVGLARTYTTLALEAVNTGTEEVSLSSCTEALELRTNEGMELTFVEPGGGIECGQDDFIRVAPGETLTGDFSFQGGVPDGTDGLQLSLASYARRNQPELRIDIPLDG